MTSMPGREREREPSWLRRHRIGSGRNESSTGRHAGAGRRVNEFQENEMAMDIFMKIAGLKGESVDKTHAGEIDVLAWSWGMSNSGSAHVGGGAGAGKVNVQDLSFTKYIDSSSPSFYLTVCTG